MRRLWFGVLCVAIWTTMLRPVAGEATDCAAASVAALAEILCGQRVGMPRPESVGLEGQGPYSLLDIKRAAAKYGIAVEGRECTLEEALGHDSPVVLALGKPDHFVVALNQDPAVLQAVDGNYITVLDREQLERRYRGVALVAFPSGTEGPHIHTAGSHYDAGTIGIGQQAVRAFTVTNRGAAVLCLELDPSPPCGVVGALDTGSVAPGGTAHLVMGMRVRAPGPTLAGIRVRTNDPARRVVFFTMAARTPPGLSVWPDHLSLVCDNAPGRSATRGSVTVRAVGGIHVLGVSVAPEVCSATISSEDQFNGVNRTQIVVGPADPVAPGSYAAELTIRTDLPTAPSMGVPLRLHVRPNAVVDPPTAFFGFVARGTSAPARQVTLATRSGEPCRVLGAVATDPRIKVERVDDLTFSVGVKTRETGTLQGEVLLTTDIPLEETVRVPVHAHVTQG